MFFLLKRETAYEMLISDLSSYVCSSDLRLRRYVGELLGGRSLGHGRVGHEDGVGLADQYVDAEGRAAGLGVEHAAKLADRLPVGTGNAADQRVRLSEGEQESREGVAVLVHHPLDLALQIAAPLQALVEIVDHLRHAAVGRSEEHTSELQSLMRISY